MIITLTGPNSYLLNAELRKIKKAYIDEYGDLAYEKVDGVEDSVGRLFEAASSLPFLASKKLVVLRNPGSQKQFADDVEQVIVNTPDTTDLIIVETKLDKRSAYFKVLKSQTDFREFVHIDSQELGKWIVQYIQNQPGKINMSDANYLIERVGQNQQLLANEIDKLLLYGPEISRANIDLLIEPTPQSSIFELLDAAFAGKDKRVIELYKEQRALKVEPQQIMAMLAWQLHILAIVKTAGERGPDQIAKDAKISPFVVRKTMGIASKISKNETNDLINRALKLDVRMKSQNIDSDDALQHFLLTITS